MKELAIANGLGYCVSMMNAVEARYAAEGKTQSNIVRIEQIRKPAVVWGRNKITTSTKVVFNDGSEIVYTPRMSNKAARNQFPNV